MCIQNDAVILIHKPRFYSSFDVIRVLRKRYGLAKIGHCGALDPLAQGLMILCSGKKTKEINQFLQLSKEYRATLTLGATTPSYDLEYPPENIVPVTHICENMVEQTLQTFRGKILQRPPSFSAVKLGGKTAYREARQGRLMELPAREIEIFRLEQIAFSLPTITLDIHCSKGTYIRSLAHDIGQRLGCGAYLSSLVRTKIGDFSLADALDILPEKTAFTRK